MHDVVPLVVKTGPTTTNTASTSVTVSGFLDSVYITGANAASISLTTDKETILSCNVASSAVYRPRLQICGTNGVALNSYDRILLSGDKLNLSSTQSSEAGTISAIIRINGE